jgi:hypothetical protein
MEPASDKMGWPQGFVLYNEKDLLARQMIVTIFTHKLQKALTLLNRAVRFIQIETPMLTYKEALKGHEETGFDLVKAGFSKHGAAEMYLRPETTFGTYAAFRALYPEEQKRKKEMPVCLWQFGKSFRDEQNSASRSSTSSSTSSSSLPTRRQTTSRPHSMPPWRLLSARLGPLSLSRSRARNSPTTVFGRPTSTSPS